MSDGTRETNMTNVVEPGRARSSCVRTAALLLTALVSACGASGEGVALDQQTQALEPKLGVFATYGGRVAQSDVVARIPFTIASADLTLPGGKPAAVSVSVSASSPLELLAVQVVKQTKPPRSVSFSPAWSSVRRSFTLAGLDAGTYELVIGGAKRTTGAFTVDLSLAGDVDGDFTVTQKDVDAVIKLQGVARGNARYLEAADFDRDGRITLNDASSTLLNKGASTRLRVNTPPAEDPAEQVLPDGALTLVDLDSQTFNPTSKPIVFALKGASFDQAPDSVTLVVNEQEIDRAQLTVEPGAITAPANLLLDGANRIRLKAYDTLGRPLYLQATIWAGASELRVNLVDGAGQPLTGQATVRATLSDDHEVSVEGTSNNGAVVFANVPFRTILLEGKTADNRFGTAAVLGNVGNTTLALIGFGSPSTVDNNDFDHGTDGWEVDGAPVTVGPHDEGSSAPAGGTQAAASTLALEAGAYGPTPPGRAVAPSMPVALASAAKKLSLQAAGELVDNDLTLETAPVMAEQAISRTFKTKVGTTLVRVRYRFITTEVPGGYFGSVYNDYFRVSLRTQKGKGLASESNSMNGLGLAAFTYATGATAWRDLNLKVDPAGDTIQVDVAVANVGDGALQSRVVVDFVEEVSEQVRPQLAWDPANGGLKLSYEIVNGKLAEAAKLRVSFAAGASHAAIAGAPVFELALAAGTAAGSYGPINIGGGKLVDNPETATHLIAWASATSLAAVADVQLGHGPNANPDDVSPALRDVVKDGQRAGGNAAASITRTAATPADQARAMFTNLTRAGSTIAANIAAQKALYAAAGDAVIDVFANEAQGLTREAILAVAADIREAMRVEIVQQGPVNVSKHCADPAVISVVDVGASAFSTAKSGDLFVASASPRVTRYFDERASQNNCFHFELNR